MKLDQSHIPKVLGLGGPFLPDTDSVCVRNGFLPEVFGIDRIHDLYAMFITRIIDVQDSLVQTIISQSYFESKMFRQPICESATKFLSDKKGTSKTLVLCSGL